MVDFSSEIFDLSSLGSNPTKETRVKSNVDKNRLPCVKTEDEPRVILSKQEFWDKKNRFRSWIRFLLLASPILTQVADSLTDGLYFVNLKLKARLVHVPAWVHIIQGTLLFTCKWYFFSVEFDLRRILFQVPTLNFSATIKDAITAYLVSNLVKNQFDWFTMKPVDNKKTLTQQVIFLACFIFEDIGQVLLQEKFLTGFLPKMCSKRLTNHLSRDFCPVIFSVKLINHPLFYFKGVLYDI